MPKQIIRLALLLVFFNLSAQPIAEVAPPFNIKTVAFTQK